MSSRMISCETARGEFARHAILSREEDLWQHLEVCDDCMDAWLVFSLEQSPEVVIPESFAYRVASAYRSDVQPQVHRNTLWSGSLALLVVVTLVLFVIQNRPNLGLSFEVIGTLLALEAAALVLWLGRTSPV